MGNKPYPEFVTGMHNDRASKLTEEQARDIILNCHTYDDDRVFGEKYGIHRTSVRHIRQRHRWTWLWERMQAAGEVC